jgi:hypothetical protein
LVGEEDAGDFLTGFFCALESGVEVADGIFVQRDGGIVCADLVRGVGWGVGEELCDIDVLIDPWKRVDGAR